MLERVEAGEALALSQEHVDAFVDLYARHIERAEQELLPMAARLPSDDELGLMGRAMRERRGIFQID